MELLEIFASSLLLIEIFFIRKLVLYEIYPTELYE